MAGLDRKKSRAAKKSPAGAGLSLQEEPSNVTFTIEVYRIALQTAIAT